MHIFSNCGTGTRFKWTILWILLLHKLYFCMNSIIYAALFVFIILLLLLLLVHYFNILTFSCFSTILREMCLYVSGLCLTEWPNCAWLFTDIPENPSITRHHLKHLVVSILAHVFGHGELIVHVQFFTIAVTLNPILWA